MQYGIVVDDIGYLKVVDFLGTKYDRLRSWRLISKRRLNIVYLTNLKRERERIGESS